jgi:uncharacterized membrane protein YozB (DUF420 family)
MKSIINYAILLLLLNIVVGQSPTHYPSPDADPINITFVNVLIYVLFPIAIVIGVIWVRRAKKKRNDKK